MRKILFLIASRSPFLKATYRARLFKWGGVNIIDPRRTFIGYGVMFDDLNPQDITIHPDTLITQGCVILAHFVTGTHKNFFYMERGKVVIERNCFIGMNTAIVKAITIKEGAIIGANSVVICNIPAHQIWGGNPAKYIKERGNL